MTSNTTNRVKNTTLITAKLIKLHSEMHLTETTSQQILSITRDAKTQGKERYYQTLSNLTDILQSSQNEQEVIQKLKQTYPTITK